MIHKNLKVKCKNDMYPHFTKDKIYYDVKGDNDSVIVKDDQLQYHLIVDDGDWTWFDLNFEIVDNGGEC